MYLIKLIKFKKMNLVFSVMAMLSLGFSGNVFAENHDVQMLNVGKNNESMVFEPAVVHAKIGDTVTFKPTTSGHFVRSTFVPDGADEFSSEEDEELKITLNKEGVYVYQCPPHRMMNMSGLIQVGKATNKAQAEKAALDLDNRATTNKERMKNYFKQIK